MMAFLIKQFGFPAWIAVLIGIGLGATMGLINGTGHHALQGA